MPEVKAKLCGKNMTGVEYQITERVSEKMRVRENRLANDHVIYPYYHLISL